MNIKDAINSHIAKEEGTTSAPITVEDFKGERTKTYQRHYDPRWDDLTDDSRYWDLILYASTKRDIELASGLIFIRAIGAAIQSEQFKVKNSENGELEVKTMLVIRPLIDERGLIGWETKEHYESFRDKHLKPYFPIIRQMLDILGNPDWFQKIQENQHAEN
ncbi:MAG TPA: hypothetical protein DDW65_21535 [Firmicutes bacterium]|jgi:hypothetical protein|nr:hypothetical protein [Bacillota bacterium]